MPTSPSTTASDRARATVRHFPIPSMTDPTPSTGIPRSLPGLDPNAPDDDDELDLAGLVASVDERESDTDTYTDIDSEEDRP
jgi:hypothetical protein